MCYVAHISATGGVYLSVLQASVLSTPLLLVAGPSGAPSLAGGRVLQYGHTTPRQADEEPEFR